MIDFFIKVKQQESQNLPLYFTKPDKIKVVGYFQKNDHLYFAENFEESGFILLLLKAAKDTNSF
jgi:isochorismate synthase